MDIGKLGESHFNLDKDNSEWLKFCKFTYNIQSDTEADEPLLTNWTPQGSDEVVYTTVREAQSGSADDVLFDLKKDLHVGADGYPSGRPTNLRYNEKHKKINIQINLIGCILYQETGI